MRGEAASGGGEGVCVIFLATRAQWALSASSHPGTKDDSTYIVQTLDFHLGHNTMVTKPCGALESPMATITKITRRRHENPPHGVATVKEWFSYVTAMRNEGSERPKEADRHRVETLSFFSS